MGAQEKTQLKIGYIPCKDSAEAKRIARLLLDAKLIACANIIPIKSMYLWEGKIVDDFEEVLLIKTTNESWSDAKALVEKEHSYEIPCIASFDVDMNEVFAKWVTSQVGT